MIEYSTQPGNATGPARPDVEAVDPETGARLPEATQLAVGTLYAIVTEHRRREAQAKRQLRAVRP